MPPQVFLQICIQKAMRFPLGLPADTAQANSWSFLRTKLDGVSSLRGRVRTLALGENDVSGVEPDKKAQIAIALLCASPTMT